MCHHCILWHTAVDTAGGKYPYVPDDLMSFRIFRLFVWICCHLAAMPWLVCVFVLRLPCRHLDCAAHQLRRSAYALSLIYPRLSPAISLQSSSTKKVTPLATTSDLLVSLESSDEEDEVPSARGGRQSMPHSQHQRTQHQQMVRRQTAEGHVSPPKTTTTAIVPANGNGATGVT